MVERPGQQDAAALERQVAEEVGVRVANLRYFGSQPWPFPHSLMIAFVADYAGGEVRPDGVEIEEARFFDVDELPQLPPGISISRKMITSVAARLSRGEPL